MKYVKYPTQIKQLRLGDKLYVLEAIRDLDEAIDLLCAAMTPEEQMDAFAEDLCPYFGILWPASIGLAEYLQQHHAELRGKSVLELGAGLGLPSLVALHAGAQVLTTDFHPDVEFYFERNCQHSVLKGDYRRLNWRESAEDIGLFDIVMGSDVLYESKHPREVVKGLRRFVKPGGMILLADPGRAYLGQFLTAMKEEGLREEVSLHEAAGKVISVYKFEA